MQGGDAGLVEKERNRLLGEAKDVLADWLDSRLGSSITDNTIFAELPRYWEQQFHKVKQNMCLLVPRHGRYLGRYRTFST